ncbi:MAG: hypothetical protein QM635_05185 [Microbacteriaceae bacterium]
MTSDHLTVNLDDIRDLVSSLKTIHHELSSAKSDLSDISEAIGYDHLASVHQDFASKWDDSRTKLLDDVETLTTMAQSVVDGFTDTDQKYADAISGKGDGQ